jgi:hypothetical protein
MKSPISRACSWIDDRSGTIAYLDNQPSQCNRSTQYRKHRLAVSRLNKIGRSAYRFFCGELDLWFESSNDIIDRVDPRSG